MPAQFTPRQISKLTRLIDPAFPTLGQLQRAVQYGLGVQLTRYSMASNLPTVILDLCNQVNQEGRIAALIKGLKSENSDPVLHQALDAFLTPAQAGAAGPLDVLLVRELPPLALINRQTLRTHLSQLIVQGSGFRAVSVAGPTACGKTHSKELIRFVAENFSYQHVQIDVVDGTATRTLREVLGKITLGLRQPFKTLSDLLPDEPTDAQAAERFVDWMGGLSQGFQQTGEQYWLTFDGLDRPGAAPVRDELIPNLLRALANDNLKNIKLFLLGDNSRRIREARRIALHEDALQITANEISLFFQNYAQRAGRQIPANDLTALVNHVVQNAQSPFDHSAMDAIGDRLETALSAIDQAHAATGP
jgi:hypothetical protein